VTERLLTAREVAERLRLCVETVLRWVKRGEFQGVVVYLPSGALRFREDRLDEWLEQRAAAPRRGVLPPRRTPPGPNATLLRATATEDEE
jgi:excisionase family DNA binding protein